MLPTFVIGLREGLEAALIVGIIAAFLRNQDRRDLLRWVLAGVVLAVLLCVGVAVALRLYSEDLPQKQQEGLETIIGVLAVGMVTYMVVWMRRHSRSLKGQLEGLAADAITARGNAARAMVLMAFLAVIREGLETVVFALAAFNATTNSTTASLGLLSGVAVAVALGYGIYRGGVRLNLSRFFRVTGVVLVVVAAGLVVNALSTAHEAGWLELGQGRTLDLSWLVAPGTVRSSLLTGMLGLQPFPVTIEVVGWLAYLVPVGLYVAWPPGRRLPMRLIVTAATALGVAAGIAALACTVLAPSASSQRPTLSAQLPAGPISVVVESRTSPGDDDSNVDDDVDSAGAGGGGSATVTTNRVNLDAGTVGETAPFQLTSQGREQHAGRPAIRYSTTIDSRALTSRPSTLSVERVAELNGGRLPIGISTLDPTVQADYRGTDTLTVWLDPRADHILDLSWQQTITATLRSGSRTVPLDSPSQQRTASLSAADRTAATSAAARADATVTRRSQLRTTAVWLLALAILALLTAGACALALRRTRPAAPPPTPTPLARTGV